MKKLFCILAIILSGLSAEAQLSSANRQLLRQKQDSLRELCYNMVNAPLSNNRMKACDAFIPGLVNALKIKGSFHFPFDSLKQVSIIYDEDSTFRIFTWGIALTNIRYRFYGALQMNTRDGQLKLFPFFDNTSYIQNRDTITSNKAWVGALYYNMVKTKHSGNTYYTLMGWGGYSFRSNEKLLDVLTFQNGKPVFGAPLFNFKKDSVPGGIKNRFFLTYKRDGNASMNYDPNLKMIIYDHLTSLNSQPEKKYTLVPDGTYEGFKWKNGYWMHVSKVFNTTSEKPPVPEPVKDKSLLPEGERQ
jgi:hypothetical protein